MEKVAYRFEYAAVVGLVRAETAVRIRVVDVRFAVHAQLCELTFQRQLQLLCGFDPGPGVMGVAPVDTRPLCAGDATYRAGCLRRFTRHPVIERWCFSLEDFHLETALYQFVRGGEAGDTSTKDRNASPSRMLRTITHR